MAALYNEEDAKLKYKKMTAHDKLMEELRAINLAPAIEGKQTGENVLDVNAQLAMMM